MSSDRYDEIKKGTKIYSAFNEYTICSQLGQGGNGTVYKATDNDKKDVAIKIVNRRLLSLEKMKRFRNELFFCSNNEHPNIVKIFDWGTHGENYVFYVMSLGICTLREKMAEKLTGKDKLEIIVSILEGLKFAHDKGIYHRDIKPENILFFEKNNNAVLCDFGIAHFCDEEQYTTVETKLTERLANFQYAAPEQREKKRKVDGRADIYACALIMNELFTGQVVSGKGYKTIGDADGNMAFLDTVFDEMYQQEPDKRLYPIEKILATIKFLSEKNDAERDIRLISKMIDDNSKVHIEDGIDVPIIVDFEVKSSLLELVLDRPMPNIWYEIISSGRYGYTSELGYGPDRLYGGEKSLCMPLEGYEDEIQIVQIVSYIKRWIENATALYNQMVVNETMRRQKEEKERLEKEIAEKQKNEKVKEQLLKRFVGI